MANVKYTVKSLSIFIWPFIAVLVFQKLHSSIIIYSAYGDQTASELRGQRCLSLKHQRSFPQPERFTEPLGALHALLD